MIKFTDIQSNRIEAFDSPEIRYRLGDRKFVDFFYDTIGKKCVYLDIKIYGVNIPYMQTGTHLRLILGRAAKAVEKVDRLSIADTGLNVSDFNILEALLHKGPLPINTIGEKVILTSGSMTTAANRLEEKKLVKRIQDPSDGRCFYLYLTKSGRKLITQAFEKHAQNLEKIAEILNSEERDELVRLLKKMGQHAKKIDLG